MLYPHFRRDPDDSKNPGTERDIFNEKPSKEDMIAATDAIGNNIHLIITGADCRVAFFHVCD